LPELLTAQVVAQELQVLRILQQSAAQVVLVVKLVSLDQQYIMQAVAEVL
jgi:hypothetical protein